ncbi:MAG TPA: hypothetical protein VGA00_01440 [Acidiferrobacterales bacterium]
MLSRLRTRRAKRRFLITALLALLLGPGLRVCLHAPHAPDTDHAHATAVHLESHFFATDDGDDQPGDRHVPLNLALVKVLVAGALIAILASIGLILLPHGPANRFATVHGCVLLPSVSLRLRPPLRAPPR